MKLEGGCHCGAVRYRVTGAPVYAALCHCEDCRKSSGAPVVGWGAFNADDFAVTRGEAKVYNSSGTAFRHFCGACGSGVWYVNETTLPGLVDIQLATLDDAEALPPAIHVQVAEELEWMKSIADLPKFDRYPGG